VSAETTALDDWEFDKDGNPIVPGGRAVAEWLVRELSSEESPQPHDYYGWEFFVPTTNGRVLIMVAGGAKEGEAYFWADTQPTLWQKLLGRSSRPHKPTLELIAGLLDGDPRFENVRIVPPGT